MSTESLKNVGTAGEDPNYQAYQAYTEDVSAKFAPPSGLEGIIRNKDLFAKAQEGKKQTDWFSQMQEQPQARKSCKRLGGLTQDQEIQIGLEMIPMFKAKEEEAQHKFDKIMEVKQQLNEFKD